MDPEITLEDLTPEQRTAVEARAAELATAAEAEAAAAAEQATIERLAQEQANARTVTRTLRHTAAPTAAAAGSKSAREQSAEKFRDALVMGRTISSDDASAGALIPEEFVPEILETAEKTTPLLDLKLITVKTMTRDSQSFPVRVNTLKGSDDAIGEGTDGAAAETEPSFKLVALKAKKYGSEVPVNEEVLEDSALDVMTELKTQIGQDHGGRLERHVIKGNGTTQPQGVTTLAGVVKVAGPAYNADAEAYAKVLVKALNQYFFGFDVGYRKDPSFAFLVNSEAYALLNSLQINGKPVLGAPTQEKPFGTLFGKPVVEVAAVDTTANVSPIVGGAWSRYLVGLRKDLTVKMTDTGGDAWEKDQVNVKYRTRYAGEVGVPEAFRIFQLQIAAAV